MAETLIISPKPGGKGRSFRVSLLGMVTADNYHASGSSRAYRPVYLSIVESDAAVRAFVANLRTGRQAEIRGSSGSVFGKPLEAPRGLGLSWSFRKMDRPAGVTVATAYMPALCDLDPGILQEDIRFLFAPPRWWVERELQAPTVQALPEEIRRDVVLGSLFAAFLDRRSPLPIVPDPLFHRRLLVEARSRDWYDEADPYPHRPFLRYPWPAVDGLETVAAVKVSHEGFEEFLRAETARYFAEESADWLLAPEEVWSEPPVPSVEPSDAPVESEVSEGEACEILQASVGTMAAPAQVSLFDLA